MVQTCLGYIEGISDYPNIKAIHYELPKIVMFVFAHMCI